MYFTKKISDSCTLEHLTPGCYPYRANHSHIGFRYFSGLQFIYRMHLKEVLDSSCVIFCIPVVHI